MECSGLTVTAGANHTCALLANGWAKCWGANGSGQLGNGGAADSWTPVTVSALSGAVTITAGLGHSCAQLANGTAKCWGPNTSGQLGNGTTTSSSTPVERDGPHGRRRDRGRRRAFVCARLTNGTIKCWGPTHPANSATAPPPIVDSR